MYSETGLESRKHFKVDLLEDSSFSEEKKKITSYFVYCHKMVLWFLPSGKFLFPSRTRNPKYVSDSRQKRNLCALWWVFRQSILNQDALGNVYMGWKGVGALVNNVLLWRLLIMPPPHISRSISQGFMFTFLLSFVWICYWGYGQEYGCQEWHK